MTTAAPPRNDAAVWDALRALAGADGVVRARAEQLAAKANVPLDDAVQSVRIFESDGRLELRAGGNLYVPEFESSDRLPATPKPTTSRVARVPDNESEWRRAIAQDPDTTWKGRLATVVSIRCYKEWVLYASLDTIGGWMGTSRDVAQDAIKELERLGYLVLLERRRGVPTRYGLRVPAGTKR